MHRSIRLAKKRLWGALLGLVVGAAPAWVQAQPPTPPAPAPATRAPALQPGTILLPLRDALVLPVNVGQRVQMSGRQRIAAASNNRENVVELRGVANDPTTDIVIAKEPGAARITLTDEQGHTEALDIIVTAVDVEYIRQTLNKTVPTAAVAPLPAGGSLVLSGTIEKAEDSDVLLRIAKAMAPNVDVINHLRVGGVQQVQLDVTVARVSRQEFRAMNFDFLTNSKNFFLSSTVGGAAVPPSSIGAAGVLHPGGGLTGGVGTPNGAQTNILFGVLHNNFSFLAFLQALRDENVVKLLSEPRLVTLSGRQASFLDGGEQAIPVPAGLGQVGVQFEEFGTRLNFVPLVLGNGKIHLEVEPEVSNLDAASGTAINGTIVPGRIVQRVHTTVELESGQTFVIGGLIQHNVIGSDEKVPVLGDIPYLGAAFSSKSYRESESELVILVTPYLVDAMSCDQLPKYLPGQETRSPDDCELFLEGILEAPRGQRESFCGHQYVAPYKSGPTADVYPCAGNGSCNAGCGTNGCGTNGCGTRVGGHAAAPAPAAAATVAQPMPMNPTAVKGDEVIPTAAPDAVAEPMPTVLPPAAPGTDSAPAAIPQLPPVNDNPPTVLPPAPKAPAGETGAQQ